MAIQVLLSSRLGEKRWTQADLSRATGIRPSTIGDLFNELTERVSLDHLDLICEALDCEVSDILKRSKNILPRTGLKSGLPRT
ncbi:MAG: helix-turn-helix transcriptional regulator [Oscillospiraceae bacterium]|jgi:putative transcriptional regulator|nr:helix-turn-helix transcriptional regulator [Oscillospiraceae bacterium]